MAEGLSAGGARLLGVRAEVGQELLLDLCLPGKDVRVAAKVLRRSEDAVGVAFSPSPDVEDALQQAVLDALEAGRIRNAVLVIDDREDVRMAMARDLRALKKASMCVGSALEALYVLEDPAYEIESAIVDVHLGDIDGWDLLAFLSAEYALVRRILISGYVPAAQLQLALKAGRCHAALEKPWTRADLAAALNL